MHALFKSRTPESLLESPSHEMSKNYSFKGIALTGVEVLSPHHYCKDPEGSYVSSKAERIPPTRREKRGEHERTSLPFDSSALACAGLPWKSTLMRGGTWCSKKLKKSGMRSNRHGQ